MNKKKLMISIDVEAQPLRAERDPLNCLIWGEYPEGRLGISEMMDIADQHGVKLTMFLDYCEKDIYGEALLDVGREIHRRGHDLQLHAHLNFLDQSFWSKHNIKPEFLLNKVDDVLAHATLDFLCEQHQIVTGSKAVAFRGGGYRYNNALLKAMFEHGVILDSSLNISRATQPVTLSPSKQFLWSSGCLEIPVSCVAGYRNLNYFFDFNFNSGYFTNVDAMIEYLDIFYSERGEDAVAVLVMHSWSFLKLTDRKYFTESVPEDANRFAEFLDSIKDKIEVITASDLVYLHSEEKLALDETLDFKNFDPPPILNLKETSTINLSSKQGVIAPYSPIVVPNLLNECCPICGAGKARFVEMNGRRCPDCGSLERQRCFAIAYDQIIHQEFDLADKHLLIFSPSVSELQFLKSRGIAGKTSIDIRPDSNPDIIADVCSMPQIESGSQICVFASYVMPNVYDMEAALDEIARILAPKGVFFSVEMLTAGSPTREIQKEENITGWYGQEAFEKYRVGSFRILGEDDYFCALSKRFTVSRYVATDPITNQVTLINMCKPLLNKKHIIMETNNFQAISPSLSTIAEPAKTATPKAEMPVSVIDASFDQLMRDIVYQKLKLPRNQARLLPHTPLNTAHKTLTKDFKEILAPVLTSWKDLANPELAIKASELPGYETESIDVFLSFGVLDFLENFSDTLNNTFRLLRQGGLALFYLKRLRIVEGTNPPTIAYLCDPLVYGLPENSRLPSMKVGRTWLLNALAQVGFEPQHFEFCSEENGETVEWFVGHKPGSTVLTDSTLETDYQEEADPVFCDICGADLSSLAKNETGCPNCHSRPRTRTIVKLGERLLQIFPSGSQAENRILLGFAMTGAEERVLIPTVYGRLQSVSLYGKYRQGHEEGVDIRDLSHYDNASFDGVFGCLLFDYFEEHEIALGEIARVLKPGGVFFTHIAPYRLSADPDSPPKTTSIIKKRPDYFDYIPDDADMPSINVGRSWFLDAIKRAGLEPELVEIVDKQSGEKIDWFLGIKAGTDTTTKSLSKTNPINLSHPPVCYSIPLPEESGYRLLDITISLPELPDSLTGMDFAEHIMDSATGSPTKTVVLCGTGSLCVSDDLGESWRTIQTKGFEGYRWWNCFTTSTGRHILQSVGWQGPDDPVIDPDKHAALLIFDHNWECIGSASAGKASWHGSTSIGESSGAIMFAEYYNNSERYRPDFKEKQQEYMKSLRPNAIWRSTDDGISWHKVLEFSPLEIRHFHTVIPDHFLPGTWWASSGDTVDESRVWRTDDNGDNWIEVTNPYPDICLPIMSEKLKCHRYTDAIIEKDSIIWGADDFLGPLNALSETLPLSERTGSRIYISPKTSPLMPRELGIIGHPIRKFVDVGPGWIIFTEAKQASLGLRPQVFLLFKKSFRLVKLMELENWRNVATGFTYSRGIKVAYNGCFFTYRNSGDVFNGGICCLKWQVKFQ